MDFTNLQVLAEVSVTLLGFSGLAAVIGHSRFDPRGVEYRTLLLLYTASAAFVGSILPLVGVPILLAAIGFATLGSVLLVWGAKYNFGRSARRVQILSVLVWVFFPLGVMVTLSLWWAVFTLAEQLLLIYQLSIGFFFAVSGSGFCSVG
jgi:hypothetical protein